MEKIKKLTIRPLNVFMRSPFITALGKKSLSRNLKIEVLLSSGVRGQGEASSSLALPKENQINMTRWLKSVEKKIVGRRIAIGGDGFLYWPTPLPHEKDHPTACGALQSAILEALSKKRKRPMASYFGPRKSPVRTDITLSAWDSKSLLIKARRHFRNGFRRFKIKVGKHSLSQDVENLHRLHRTLKGSEFWVDANQGWNIKELEVFIRVSKKEKWNIRAIEQPTPKGDMASLTRASRLSPTPIFADESANTLEDLKKLVHKKAIQGVVIKIAKSGLLESQKMVRYARSKGIQTLLSCMAESARGLAPSVHWAIGDGKFDGVDLDSFLLTKSRLPRSLYKVKGPWLSLPH